MTKCHSEVSEIVDAVSFQTATTSSFLFSNFVWFDYFLFYGQILFFKSQAVKLLVIAKIDFLPTNYSNVPPPPPVAWFPVATRKLRCPKPARAARFVHWVTCKLFSVYST